MFKRRRSKQLVSFQDRLAAFVKETREEASLLPPGIEKDDLLRKARQADIAFHFDDWVNSPGLQPPSWALALRTIFRHT